MSCTILKMAQREWARRNRIVTDAAGYVRALDQNLLLRLSDDAVRDFSRGSGGELGGTSRRRPKLNAVHSSAALACNAFEYWRKSGLGFLQSALQLPAPILEFRFEGQFPTGLEGEPPNVDVALELRNGSTWAIESKFTEPFCSSKDQPRALKDKYFEKGVPLWTRRGLPKCGALATAIHAGAVKFRRLDAAQLLKHARGLHTCRRTFSLCYIWLDVDSAAGVEHRNEVAQFEACVASEVDFHALPYQQLVAALRTLAGPFHDRYFRYLDGRYFQPTAR